MSEVTDIIARAGHLVDRATTARLSGHETVANELLKDAADLYELAGEYGEAKACRELMSNGV